jgi:nitroreductase
MHDPEFGQPLPVRAAPEVLEFLANRRSASAMNLAAPGPDGAQLDLLLRLAARVPDHGKLAPWRFVVLEGDAKSRFVARLEAVASARADGENLVGKLGKLRVPPLTVAVISAPVSGKIPLWEQQLSVAAVCLNLCHAAQAMGFGANWITDWYAYDAEAVQVLGLRGDEQIAGFIHIGTASEAPLERVRPDVRALTTRWQG